MPKLYYLSENTTANVTNSPAPITRNGAIVACT